MSVSRLLKDFYRTAYEGEEYSMEMTALCIGFVLLGFCAGKKFMPKDMISRYIGKTLLVLVILLVFLLGTMIGTDEKVISSLGSIGITSFVLAVFTMIGSVTAVSILRKLLKIDKRGFAND